MGASYVLVVLVAMALLLTTGLCNVGCGGTDGHVGEAGIRGRDGWPGAKGEKGEPAAMPNGLVDPDVLLRLKGEIGSRGKQGAMGPKGYRGEVGSVGKAGKAGQPGPQGQSIGHGDNLLQQTSSAFSVMRTDESYPPYDQVVTYQTTVVNTPPDFNAATGHFICRIPGAYYFSFHAMAKVSMCLRIASDPPFKKVGFCDYNRNTDQVLSGGVVLQLAARQKVWLESFKDQQRPSDPQDTNEKQIIFSGFLLFVDSE